MKKLTSLSIYCLLLVFFSLTVVSCKEDAPTPPAEQKAETTTEVAVETSTETPVETPNVKFLNDEKFAGEKNVTVTVEFPGDTSAEWVDNADVKAFKDAKIYNYKGKTTIIFNKEKSTDDKMVFSMTENAMGLKELMYEVFKNKTFRSDSYGTDNVPFSKLLIEKADLKLEDVLAGKDKETFDVSLNEIIFEGDKAPIFVFDTKNTTDEDIKAVPFVCSYSAWERIMKLKQAGDKDILEFEKESTYDPETPASIEKMMFTLNPNYYFNVTTIEKDEHEDKVDYYTVAKASYDKEKKELTFEFSMDYSDLGNYIKVKAVYSL